MNPEVDESEESETHVLLGPPEYWAFVLIEPKWIRKNIQEVLYCFFWIVVKIVWTFTER